MRLLVMSVLLLATQLPAAAGQSHEVDLDVSGALEALARDNPAHFQKVREIIVDIQGRSVSEVPRWMETGFGARGVTYEPFLLVSLPPKRRLQFSIDDVRYRATITEESSDAAFQSAAFLEGQDGSEAIKTYKRAARLGSDKARKRLAEVYEKGLLGAPRNDVEAQRWREQRRENLRSYR